ncbi:MAG TPA: ATP-binding protein, partial [Chromatiaceae bacterium]|nr:ATP-binding protein [Chromatiaceae bacterium]
EQVARYQARISGPLLDRIDIQVQVPTQPAETLLERNPARETSSEEIRRSVELARQRQLGRQGRPNAQLVNSELELHCKMDGAGRELLLRAMNSLGLSARAYHRILRVARTIADLEGREHIELPHLTEAIGYRRMSMATH